MLKINNHEFEIEKGCGGYFSDFQTWTCKKCGSKIKAFDDTGNLMMNKLKTKALNLPKCEKIINRSEKKNE